MANSYQSVTMLLMLDHLLICWLSGSSCLAILGYVLYHQPWPMVWHPAGHSYPGLSRICHPFSSLGAIRLHLLPKFFLYSPYNFKWAMLSWPIHLGGLEIFDPCRLLPIFSIKHIPLASTIMNQLSSFNSIIFQRHHTLQARGTFYQALEPYWQPFLLVLFSIS